MKNNRYQILVVDDDPQIPRLIELWLNHEFAEIADVTSIVNPQEAFGRIHLGGVELLITDLNMPSLNGYHLLKELKSIDPMSQVLFLTGQPSHNAIRSAFKMGADEYVMKPVDRQSLVDCVRYLLARLQRWQSELGFQFANREELTTSR